MRAAGALAAWSVVALLTGGAPLAAQEHDHGGHQGQDARPPAPRGTPADQARQADEPAGHEGHAAHGAPRTPIPPVTDADRAAAFPDVEGHTVHDRAVHYSVLLDQLEWQGGGHGGLAWDTTSWVGGDVHRAWVRTEGEMEDGRVDAGDVHALYGRAVARWWDLVAGVRQDFGEGPPRTWAAVGLQGLAPFWFEVQATAYVGAGGRTHARLEAEYELLLTNRLALQPLVEVELYGRDDPERGVGAGLSTLEAGARLRYEVRREVAPYVGVTWERAFGVTGDLRRRDGQDRTTARAVAGLRLWF